MNKRYWATALVIPAVFGLFATSNALADNTTVTVNVTNISLELDVPSDPVVLTLRPTATGANFGSVDLTATVGTNNPAGYQLSVEFSDTCLIRTAAIGNDTPEINTLDDLSGGYAENDFTVNRWGQKVTGDNYFPVPSGTLAPASWSSDEPVNNADNTITLAAKADGTIPSGTYEVTLTYTLVANVIEDYTTFDRAYANAGKTRDINSDKYQLQEMTPAICSAVTTGQTGQLVDTRDGTVYKVGKLADERCWILENLALDLTATGASGRITPINTNADTTSLNALFGVAVRDATDDLDGNLATAGVTDYVSSNSYSDPIIGSTYKDTTNPSDPVEIIRGSKYGIYYNYCAASAGSYCYGNGTSGGISQGKAKYDICPAGWRMPMVTVGGTTIGEYKALYDAYDNSINNLRTALLAPLSGYRYGDYEQGSSGYFWSSTGGYIYPNDSYMHSLRVSSSAYGGGELIERWFSASVRCIAIDGNEPVEPIPGTNTFDEAYAAAGKPKDVTSGKYKISDMSTSICEKIATGQTGQLVDTRDGTVYNVGKLADDRCWLLDNLALDIVSPTVQANLSPDNTNASATAITNIKNGGNPGNNDGWATEAVSYAGSSHIYNQPRINVDSINVVPSDSLSTNGGWKVGVYYNYCAASMGTYCYTSNNGIDRPGTAIDTENDVCPANWRMPTGSTYDPVNKPDGEEANNLYRALTKVRSEDSEKLRFRKALRFPLSGMLYNGSARYQNSYGFFWTSTYWKAAYMNYVLIYPGDTIPQDDFERWVGFSVRCIAK